MAEPYATVDDYVTQTQATLTDAQRQQVTALLAGASAIMRGKLPQGYEPDPDVAQVIAIAMVQRRMTNPGGRRSKTVGQTSETYDQDGGLYLADHEEQQLLAGWDEAGGAAYTIKLRDEAYPPGCPGPYSERLRYRHHHDGSWC